MGFWTNAWSRAIDGITANANAPATPPSVGEPSWTPGDPDGVELVGFDEQSENRSLPIPLPSPWSGWPSDWNTGWTSTMTSDFNKLIDIAWSCVDLNSNVLSAMPVYQLRGGRIIEPTEWMRNPDDDIYTSWQEFAKQLIWDFQLGEAFVLPMAHDSAGKPSRFRVIPPWLMKVEMGQGRRLYTFGNKDVTDEILHIRYSGNSTDPRGRGPLQAAGGRILQIGLLERYANNLAETGGVPLYWLTIQRRMNESEGRDVLERWIESRTKYAGYPALVTGGTELQQGKAMSARDMALMELSQFNESRIAIMLGVPPFLVGLAGATGSLTYSNIADLFDFHDRSSLRPKSKMCMEALSEWALPRGRSAELNRDDYTRLPLDKRMQAYKIAIELEILTVDEVRIMERFHGDQSALSLTGGAD